MPESLTYTEAASVPVVYGTAYECLVNVAHLKRGEKVLIHAAAGGVGQAAIRVAQWIGAHIYCTVGTLDKRSFLGDVYGIPESHVFSSRSLDFSKGLLLATDIGVGSALRLLPVSWISENEALVGGHRHESAQGQSLKDILGAHMEFHEAFNVIFEVVAGRIAGIMMKSEDIFPDDRIAELGLDSLIAVELRNWIVKQVDVSLTVIDIVNSGTVAQLVRVIIENSSLVQVS